MAIRLIDVSHRFGPLSALDRVSLHVHPGDCYGFVGHNGAGKTTTMRIVLGLLRPRSGEIYVDGFDARRWPREARARIGALIDTPAFYDRWSGRRNLIALGRLQGLGRPEARSEADRVLDLVGLTDAADRHSGGYSQGMRQRLGIAQALLGDPPILLLDEPTNGLDPEGIAAIRTLLHHLNREEHRTLVISSHQLHELSGLCNRVGAMQNGRVVVEEETEKLLAAGRRRYRLRTDDEAAALRVLEGLGVRNLDHDEPGLLIDLGERAPAEVTRALVGEGRELVEFASHPATLEEIYLGLKSETPLASTASSGSEHPDDDDDRSWLQATPAKRKAQGSPVFRIFRHDLSRVGGKAVLLLLPALLAVLTILGRRHDALENAAAVADDELFSTTQVTAFEATARALQAALPLAILVIAGLASQSLAAERSRGTLKILLQRPIRRIQLVLGKALGMLSLALFCYLALLAAALGAAAWAFDFGDLTELLPNGATMPLVAASDLWPDLRRGLLSPVAPLTAYAAIGFLAGSVMRSGAGALALSLGMVGLLDLSRTVARSFDGERWLPSAYLPSPLGDRSFIQFLLDSSQGVSNTSAPNAAITPIPVLLWIVVGLALAAALITGRSDVEAR